jgi:ABC-type lipoprotein release transport system permease subunit
MTKLPVSPQLLVPTLVALILLGALLAVGKVPFSYNVRNLLVRWRMTLMTALAFTLVIGILTVMLAFVNGMSRLTEGSGRPENVIVLADGSNDEAFSQLSFGDTANIGAHPAILRNEQQQALCSRELYIIASMPIPTTEGMAPDKSTKGKIQKVFIELNEFLLTDDKNDDRRFHLADGGKVLANSTEGKLENLRPGDNVWVGYEERNGQPWATEIRGSNRRRLVQVRGMEDVTIGAQVHGLELAAGNWFGGEGVVSLPGNSGETAVQAVVGEGFARELGPDLKKPRLEVGDVFELGLKKWQVVGILKSEGTTFGSEVWAKRSYVGDLYGKPSTISSVAIRTGSADKAAEVARYLREDFKDAKLLPQTETEYYSKLQGTNLQFTVAIGFFTFFMAIGGIFGVMNTMFAAISQRTKDIGVMRILGYARWQILISFLIESLVIALAGGLLGCALGFLSDGWTATSIVGSGQGGFGKTVILRLVVDANILAVGMILTLAMGLLGGLLPSLSAMRLRPLEALR